MSEFIKENYTLCYRKNKFDHVWKCEFGFESTKDVDKRAFSILETNKDAVTTFFPVYNCTPQFIQKQKIKYNLIPVIQ